MRKLATLSDANTKIARRVIAFLRTHDPMRMRPLGEQLGISHQRLDKILRSCVEDGRIDRIPDGKRNGETVYLYTAGNGMRAGREPVSYNAMTTLSAFQAAAAQHIAQLRACNPAMRGMYA
ncbi:MarR family transcriptional regulator [Burkholderia ubonensis]|uniref:MarR family transcriptional regulator n=1 Tax=Burkholderia ubonensis TaxID=101571 RepID=A0ABD4E095_9BURK|nr:helix-turn-helix domain-containing protein [Burkholderia ubonensis]KVN83430.1 hypothetical protein WJ68_16070 [Burkholderia ubonensis]